MLSPKYLVPPSDLPLGSRDQFRVTGYYLYQDYALVQWEAGDFSDEGEYVTGESLYRNGALVVSSGGSILLADDKPIDKSLFLKNPADYVNQIIDPAIGAYGVPQNIAYALRDLANYRSVRIKGEYSSARSVLIPMPIGPANTQEVSS